MKMIAVAGMKGDVYTINAHHITELSEQKDGLTSLIFLSGASTANGQQVYLRCDELAKLASEDPSTVGVSKRVTELVVAQKKGAPVGSRT